MVEKMAISGHRPVRVVTAASLFDGHDAAINIVRRILQQQGAEVIHLGHDRSAQEIATAAIQEDADAVAVSSYQGGHNEFFRYLIDLLSERESDHLRVYGGGGGTIQKSEAEALQAYGVARIFRPEDGRGLGLRGMVEGILAECTASRRRAPPLELEALRPDRPAALARCISRLERARQPAADEVGAAPRDLDELRVALARRAAQRPCPVVGLTGSGGAGKSTVLDELLRRVRRDSPTLRVGLLLVDPSRRRSGGALLGDRIRLGAIDDHHVFVRSLATRTAHRSLSATVQDAVLVLKAAHFDLVFVETAGTGQADSEVVDLSDLSVYVMTPEFGAPSQLEKIDMLELADLVVLNKSDRRGAQDALRDVRKQWQRNHQEFSQDPDRAPVFPCVASDWDDPGVERLFLALRRQLAELGLSGASAEGGEPPALATRPPLIAPARSRYLSEIASAVRAYRSASEALAAQAQNAQALRRAVELLGSEASHELPPATVAGLAARRDEAWDQLPDTLQNALQTWPKVRGRYGAERQQYQVRGQPVSVDNYTKTLSDGSIPRVATPRSDDWGELTHYLRDENLPGHFPFTAGVFPFKRQAEDPGRMFAGEGGPEQTNRRFQLLAKGQRGVRLSTAFDSVTLYGRNPARRPDIYGKVGNAGVSVATLDDAKKLYSGFDLTDPHTSVSMTINGPAPIVLAFFFNTAIDQQVERHLRERGELEGLRQQAAERAPLPAYRGELPDGHSGLGLGLLGIPGDQAVDRETYERIRADVLRRLRGTVQADILKEDQAQNTCIFSIGFSLRMMGDIQRYFTQHRVRNFYSVSISGYHIAEAGANPITQLAFTLANGFTYVEHYLARGMDVDDFVPNFSFFFSNGLDAEYSVMGRVARRIWAIAMRERYGASERSQKLKYHVQTSGRSLHAQEMAFNDIRTTLQALSALQDHCNSLHTNAYDEAVTTPTEASVRRALAIQLIIGRELGLMANENPLQGSYLVQELTDQVEAAVLAEFDRISERGGVLGAMESLYQRGAIQEQSLHYEALKHSGELPIIGVNTFEAPPAAPQADTGPGQALIRSDDADKDYQLQALEAFHARHRSAAPSALERLQRRARQGDNLFEELMETVKVASLGQITDALFEVGGKYRRSM